MKIKLFSGSLVTLFFFSLTVQAQQDIKFPAGDLNKKSFQILGDSAAWPVLYQQAEYDALSNSFVAKGSKTDLFKKFKLSHASVLSVKESRSSLIRNGARLFAEKELENLNKSLDSYDQAIGNGNLQDCLKLSEQIQTAYRQTNEALDKNRVQSVSARLEERIGSVFQRKGLLGSWNDAVTGNFFEENDGIKTLKESQATLEFKDGSEVVVEELTIATVKAARIDRLNQQVKTEVTLVNGSLLAKIAENSKQNRSFNLNLGTTKSDLQTSKFWANKSADKKIQMSNYDGEAKLTASNVSVTLKKNQGTVVVEGKAPQLPVDLLPSPKMFWPRQDSIIFQSSIVFKWTPVKNSKSYQVELAKDSDFKTVFSKQRVNSTSLQSELPLDEPVFVRIQAFDGQDIRGGDSPTYRVIRNDDKIPPAIFLNGITSDQVYIPGSDYQLTGQTEAFATLISNEKPVEIKADGSFSLSGVLREQNFYFRLKVTDRAGNSRERKLTITRMDTTKMSAINWNIPVKDRVLAVGSTTVTASGKAYPNIKVTLTQGSQIQSVQTSPDGDWAIRFVPESKEPVSIRFTLTTSDELIHQIIYSVR
ncbi:MAG: FecR domain-containing protein [Bacteroidetes bacterium]|nr:FecR domain-containing protein [Bacteroidota bacterium]